MSGMFKKSLKKKDGRQLFLYSYKSEPKQPKLQVRTKIQLASIPNSMASLRAEWVAYASHREERTFLPPKEFNPLKPTTDPKFPTELPKATMKLQFLKIISFDDFQTGGRCEVVVFSQTPIQACTHLLWII